MRSQEPRARDGEYGGDDCPTIAGLLLAHEGELSRRAQTRVQAHLRRCAVCRSEVDRVDAIAEAYHARSLVRRPRASVEGPPVDRSEQRFAEFRERLHAEQRETARRSLHVPSRRWIPIAALVPLLILGILLSRTYTSVVHADELLARAVAQERSLPHGTMQRLQFDLLPLRRGAGGRPVSFVRDVAWSDGMTTMLAADGSPALTGTRRLGNRAEAVAEAQVVEYLTRHQFDSRRPLSVARFQAWRASLASRTDTITPNGAALVVLKTTTTEGALREATLTVRRSDFHAVRQSLTFEGLGRLEIAEISKWVTPVTKTVELPAPVAAAETMAAVLPDPDTLDEAELDVRLVLQDLREDLTSELKVSRTPRQVLVEGTVSSASQRRRLAARLGALPYVKAALRSLPAAGHPAAGEAGESAPAASAADSDAGVAGASPVKDTPPDGTPEPTSEESAPLESAVPANPLREKSPATAGGGDVARESVWQLPARPVHPPMMPAVPAASVAPGMQAPALQAEVSEAPFLLSVVPAGAGASGIVPGAGFARWLARTFGNAFAAERYLPELLRMVGAVRQRLTAMQGLASRYPDGAAPLSPSARTKLQRLMDAHDRELRGDLERADARLALLLGTATRPAWPSQTGAAASPVAVTALMAANTTPVEAAAWQRRVASGMPYADALQRLVQQLPTEQDEVPLPPEIQQGIALEPPVLTELRRVLDELWTVLGAPSGA